jgi:hypothetical protein
MRPPIKNDSEDAEHLVAEWNKNPTPTKEFLAARNELARSVARDWDTYTPAEKQAMGPLLTALGIPVPKA